MFSFLKYEFWSQASNPGADIANMEVLKQLGIFSQAEKFWTCFSNALDSNKKGPDGKQRILSIIADSFTYHELEEKLEVINNLNLHVWTILAIPVTFSKNIENDILYYKLLQIMGIFFHLLKYIYV